MMPTEQRNMYRNLSFESISIFFGWTFPFYIVSTVPQKAGKPRLEGLAIMHYAFHFWSDKFSKNIPVLLTT